MNVEKTIETLKKNGFKVSFFENKEAAADYIVGELSGKTIGIGGSKTVEALGVYERLMENNTVYWHWFQQPQNEVRYKAAGAQVNISSANGIAETGEIVNIDGSGNRVASTLFGHEKLIIVAGVNKIAPDGAAALYRARNVASPLNARRLGMKTPCATGELKCHDCSSPQRICGGVSTLLRPMFGIGETEVILINEELGY